MLIKAINLASITPPVNEDVAIPPQKYRIRGNFFRAEQAGAESEVDERGADHPQADSRALGRGVLR